MFSGIVQVCIPVTDVTKKPGLSRITLKFPTTFLKSLKHGASVSVSGVCLTVVAIKGQLVSFELMQETLAKTTMGAAVKGDKLNIERSVRFGDEIGGHIVSGHVDCNAEIVKVEEPKNNKIMTFQLSKGKNIDYMRYIFPKGFVAIDGASLTVVDVDRKSQTFTVHLIPETLRITSFGFKKRGDHVNVEVDRLTMAVVDTMLQLQGALK